MVLWRERRGKDSGDQGLNLRPAMKTHSLNVPLTLEALLGPLQASSHLTTILALGDLKAAFLHHI